MKLAAPDHYVVDAAFEVELRQEFSTVARSEKLRHLGARLPTGRRNVRFEPVLGALLVNRGSGSGAALNRCDVKTR